MKNFFLTGSDLCMNVAVKTPALTIMELFKDPAMVAKTKEEFLEQSGTDFRYIPFSGDRASALNYRI